MRVGTATARVFLGHGSPSGGRGATRRGMRRAPGDGLRELRHLLACLFAYGL